MPTPPPIPPDSRSPYGPEGAPKTFTDVSHRLHDAMRPRGDDVAPAGPAPEARLSNPWPMLLGVALAGYVVGALIHRR